MKNFKEWFALRNENAFYGLRDLQNELNDKINTFLFKNKNNSHYVTLHHEDGKMYASVYLSKELDPTLTNKLVSASKYFLKELGVEIGPERRSQFYEDAIEIPIISYPNYDSTGQWDHLKNPVAKSYLQNGKAIDVSDLGIEVKPGIWKLNKFIDGAEYYDSKHQAWIKMIVKDKDTGEMYASVSNKGFPQGEYETIWLR